MDKFAENCKISQKVRVSRQILGKIDVQLCEDLHCLKEILISFHIFFISSENLAWFLSYVILNFAVSGFPLTGHISMKVTSTKTFLNIFLMEQIFST